MGFLKSGTSNMWGISLFVVGLVGAILYFKLR